MKWSSLRRTMILAAILLTSGQGCSKENPGTITGMISLAPELASQVRPGDTLYVVARHPRLSIPLANQKIKSPVFPVAYELTFKGSMFPAMARDGVIVEARLSHRGMIIPAGGDLGGLHDGVVYVGDTAVDIIISGVRRPKGQQEPRVILKQ